MKSNYRRIGDFIRLVDERNKGLKVTNLVGLSISKQFIKSVANTIGTDMENYKIIRQNQFACSTMQVRRDKKMPLALYTDMEPAIISQAYPVFEIIDVSVLSPEYLMMWFTRSEFDRQACFHAVGGVRGSLEWEDFLDLELPIPSIEKQRAIVNEYNTVVNRIQLNEQLNQKLEETAQAIYKEWFVDFEFPNKNENGKPYKSGGGKMIWCEELEKEIPEGWEVSNLGELLDSKGYIRGPFGSALKKDDMVEAGVPVYEQQHAIYNHRNFRYYISKSKYLSLKRFEVRANDLVVSCSGTLGKITIISEKDPIGIINQALLILRVNSEKIDSVCLYYYLTSNEGNGLLIENATGSAQVNMAKREFIQGIPFILPAKNMKVEASRVLTTIYNNAVEIKKQNDNLKFLIDVLLSKMTKI